MASRKQATRLFAGLGLLPFIGAATAAWFSGQVFGLSALFIFVSYSAVILSFLGGILWGRVIDQPLEPFAVRILIISNVFSLLGWLALLLSELALALPILVLGYIAALVVELRDRHLLFAGAPDGYSQMRVVLTAIVVGLHVFMMAMILGFPA